MAFRERLRQVRVCMTGGYLIAMVRCLPQPSNRCQGMDLKDINRQSDHGRISRILLKLVFVLACPDCAYGGCRAKVNLTQGLHVHIGDADRVHRFRVLYT